MTSSILSLRPQLLTTSRSKLRSLRNSTAMRITYQCQPNDPGEDLAYHVGKTLSQGTLISRNFHIREVRLSLIPIIKIILFLLGVLEAVLQQLQSTQMSLKSTAKSKSCPDLRKKRPSIDECVTSTTQPPNDAV